MKMGTTEQNERERDLSVSFHIHPLKYDTFVRNFNHVPQMIKKIFNHKCDRKLLG